MSWKSTCWLPRTKVSWGQTGRAGTGLNLDQWLPTFFSAFKPLPGSTHPSEMLVMITHFDESPWEELYALQSQVPFAHSPHRECHWASRDLASSTDLTV